MQWDVLTRPHHLKQLDFLTVGQSESGSRVSYHSSQKSVGRSGQVIWTVSSQVLDLESSTLTFSGRDRINTRTDHQKSLSELADLVNIRIIDKGFVLINKEPTFNTLKSDIHKPTQVDHIYSNSPSKILNTTTIHNTNSNHSAISILSSSKQQTNHQNYYIIRDYTKFDKTKFNKMIINHPKYLEALTMEDTNQLSESINDIILSVLNVLAPITRRQSSKKKKTSKETRTKLAERDVALMRARTSGDSEDKRHYKNLRNIASAAVRKDKIPREIKLAKDNTNSDRAKCNLVKDKMKGKNYGPQKN